MLMCVFVAIGSFFMLHNTRAAIEALIIGFLVSPYGIPMIGAAIIAFLQGINESIKSI
ncbi:CD1845 family protein [Fusobacterium necrophorum]|nr:CD1845 family protein [Fusobacterium necrophorum]MDK4471799.1 CD1845 family protein [Fusobacterium necrophorum]MDK4473986.1 CD1845 family protein [Fusobacterium necrophorum]MDK4476680.1 CD1845 family protein [Fusobacterium necrophorum]MDK4480286.1 CD1845 family protein [Fusobacterium necrophorum]